MAFYISLLFQKFYTKVLTLCKESLFSTIVAIPHLFYNKDRQKSWRVVMNEFCNYGKLEHEGIRYAQQIQEIPKDHSHYLQ